MDQKREKDLKDLSQLIVTALTKDEGVIKALSDLKKRRVIESSTLLGLALKINDLLELSGSVTAADLARRQDHDPAEDHPASPTAEMSFKNEPKVKEKPRKRAMIDGIELSSQEILFEEWSHANFDEEQWFKKNGLVW